MKTNPSHERYQYVDAAIVTVSKKTARASSSIRSAAFDDLNVIDRVYDDLMKEIEAVILRVARYYYRKYVSADDDKKTDITERWLYATLFSVSNPVTHYIYKNEVKRKRAYLREGIISGKMAGDRSVANTAVKTSMRHTFRMAMQYILDAADAAAIEAYKDSGVKYVKWNSIHDGKACDDCGHMNGEVFPIEKAPPKQHYNCRCYYTPTNRQGSR